MTSVDKQMLGIQQKSNALIDEIERVLTKDDLLAHRIARYLERFRYEIRDELLRRPDLPHI